MGDRIPWKGLEKLGVFLVALHSFLIGLMLIFATATILGFAGWEEVPRLFFPRQSGVFHIILAAGYWWEYRRHGTIGLMLMAKTVARSLVGAVFGHLRRLDAGGDGLHPPHGEPGLSCTFSGVFSLPPDRRSP